MRITTRVAGALLFIAILLLLPTNSNSASSKRAALTAADFEKMLTSISNWGRWGKDDQLGALNLITAEKRRQAARLVRDGISVSLAHNALKEKVGGSGAFEQRMIMTGLNENANASMDSYSVAYHGYTQTHLDALCHLFHKGQMYNGISQREVTERGAQRLSVLAIKDGLFTRGVLMDMPALTGAEFLIGAKAIYPEDLEAWEKKAGIKVGSGDAILIRTGRWARRAAQGDWDFEKGSAGLDASCLPWLKSRDVAILGSDLAADVMPSGIEGVTLPVHFGSIYAMGVPILDNLDLEPLSAAAARQRRWEFLLTAAPLRVEGGTGSPINPIATF